MRGTISSPRAGQCRVGRVQRPHDQSVTRSRHLRPTIGIRRLRAIECRSTSSGMARGLSYCPRDVRLYAEEGSAGSVQRRGGEGITVAVLRERISRCLLPLSREFWHWQRHARQAAYIRDDDAAQQVGTPSGAVFFSQLVRPFDYQHGLTGNLTSPELLGLKNAAYGDFIISTSIATG